MEIDQVVDKYLTEKVNKRRVKSAEKMIEKLGFKLIKNSDTDEDAGQIRVSMEEGDGAGDYYNQSSYGAFGIADSLNKIAKKFNSYWEWENPAVISMYVD
jgi:hypothetical protein